MLSAITRNAIKPAMIARVAARPYTVAATSIPKQDQDIVLEHPQAMPMTDSTVYAQQATLKQDDYVFSEPAFTPTVNAVFDD